MTNRALHRLHSLRHERDGSAAVELALLAPVFLLMLFGLIAYGIDFGACHSIQQIAADAARTAVAGMTETERQALVARFVARNAGDYPFIDGKALVVAAVDSPSDANQFMVRVRYDASGLPIWTLFRDLPLPGRNIARSSTIRLGGL